jgi:hypothetical protein
MLTLDAVRAAVLSDQPWNRLDELVRAELTTGRTIRQIYKSLTSMADEIDATPGLTEDGSDAFGDALDALTGMCHPDCQYKDPPNAALPSEEEMAELPRWAAVAFAARCARRVLPLFGHKWPDAPAKHAEQLAEVVGVIERSAAHAGRGDDWAPPAGAIACAAYVCDAVINADRDRARAVEVITATSTAIAKFKDAAENVLDPHIGTALRLITHNTSVATSNGIATSRETYDRAALVADALIRQDFDRVANIAEWQKWTDDTPVPPEVFGPLWPEGPPKNWPTAFVPAEV